MANGDGMDPKTIAQARKENERLKASLQETKAVLMEIYNINEQTNANNSDALQAIEQRLNAWQQERAILLETQNIYGTLVDYEERRNNNIKEELSLLQQELNALVRGPEARQRALDAAITKQRNLKEEVESLEKTEAEGSVKLQNAQRALTNAKNETNRIQREALQLNDQERKGIANKIAAQIRFKQAQLETSQNAQQSMQMMFGLDNKWRQTLAGSSMRMFEASSKAHGVLRGIVQTANTLTRTLDNASSAANIAGSTMMKVQERTITMITQIDRSDVALRSATGASKQFAQGLQSAYQDRAIKRMAASYEELSRMQQTVYSLSRQYSSQSAQERLQIDRLAMSAQRAGISYEDFATVVDKSTRIFGDKSTAAIKRLYSSAVSIGELPSRYVKMYINSLDTLAQYSGPRAVKVLQQLGAVAKATAIDSRALIGVTQQFDTFEGAASSVARLNAALGGPYLNSIRMLKADEGERLMMLKEMWRNTNMNWDSLGRFQKRLIATASGFKSLAAASAFFKGDMDKFKKLTQEQEKNAESQQKLINAGASLVTIAQRLGRAFEEFGGFAQSILPWVRALAKLLNNMTPTMMALSVAGFKVASAIAAIGARASAAQIATKGLAAGFAGFGTSLVTAIPLIGMAMYAIYRLNDAMTEENSPQAYTLPNQYAMGMQRMATAAKMAGPELENFSSQSKTISNALSSGHSAVSKYSSAVGTLMNNLNRGKRGNIMSLSRVFGSLQQLGKTNVETAGVVRGLGQISKAVQNLDEKKVKTYARSISQLSYAIKTMPKQTVVEVAALTRAQNAGVSSAVAGARSSAVRAQASSTVQAAKQAEAPRGGRKDVARDPGVLVTDSLHINLGGNRVIKKKILDVVNEQGDHYRRTASRRA